MARTAASESAKSTRASGKTEPLKLKLKGTKARLVKAQQDRTDDKVAALKRSYDQASAEIERKGWKRSSPDRSPEEQTSSSTDVGRNHEQRKGKGVIDRFEFTNDEQHLRQKNLARRKSAPRTVQEIEAAKSGLNTNQPGRQNLWEGPESGLPPPIPDPRYNPPQGQHRSPRIITDRSTWTGCVVRNGVFEWSKVNRSGFQEWLSAREERAGEWTIIRSSATKR